jgi:hypothetical protein
VKKILKEYRIELIGLAVMFIAGFMLLNRNRMGATRWASQVFVWKLSVWFGNLLHAISNYLAQISVMEWIAWLLIIGWVVFFAWRIRYRFLKSDYWQVLACPKCGSTDLHRVHRTSFDRLLGSILLPQSARYRCSNSECHWSGLRQSRQQSGADLQAHKTSANPGNQG